ncbi:Cyclic nucleotide-gated cation channel [Papilio machaon]|uniref:Cyclic nucleotide-gated cation channel n=1 Tax=Papilio machaon TaxID=76193 RepID=A0A194QXA9_PAPMA|nr:Cyclic nucleotide-gated cation channel [Papilio machaon]
MQKSFSEPSLGTIGTGTLSLNANTAMSHMSLHQTKIKSTKFKGKCLWNGRIGVVTRFMLDLPWNLSWQMRSSRMKIYIMEHVLSVILLSHVSTCLWYSMHVRRSDIKEWHKLGYPEHVNRKKLQFNRHEIYLSGQQIWCQGVVKGGMIWIKKGVVELLSDEDDESPMIAFKEGTVLRRTEFLRAMNENPVKLKEIRDKVENRLSNSRRRQEAITNYDKGDSRLIRTRYRPMKVFKEHLSGLEEEDSTFVDDSHLYYRDENNVRQRKFTTEYLELYKISENVTTMDEPTICLKSKFPWILEPNTDFILMFDIAHFFTILYVCIMSPYLAIRSHESNWEKVMNTVVFTALLLNIYIQLTTAVVDKNTIKDTVKDIAEVKMANIGFYLDILSIFPLHIFTDTLDPKRESILSQLVVMLPIVQVWHIWSYLSKWENNFNVSVRLICLLKYGLLIMISCYWSGCLLYLIACPKKLCIKSSWMAQLIYWETKIFVTNDAKHEKPIITALDFGTSIFTGSGTSDLAPGMRDLIFESSHDFLQTVAAKIKTIVLPDNEIVQHAGDIGRDMYILSKGHCKVISYKGVTVNNGGPGSKFGVFEMLYGLPKVYTVVTSTNCILLHLDYRTLVQCWSIFPDISHIVMMVLHDPEICEQAKSFENAKPLTGRLDVKTNRITQEIKESFIVINDREEKTHYLKAFEQLGVMRLIRYIFLPICITPHGIFLKFWCTLRLLVAIYYILIVPYNISTKQHKYGNSYIWSDIFLYLDIAVMAYVAFYDERYLLVTHPLLTVTRYLKRAFILDIISIFPFEQLSNIINEHSDTDLYRLNRILLVTRVLGAFSYWENDIMRINQAVVLFKFLPLVATVVNSATAFIFISSCQPFLPPDSYYVLVNCSRTFVISGNTYEIKYAITEYIHTFYWVFELFVGCGCTPIVLSNKADVWLSMALQISGALYFAFMFGYIASTQSTASHALLEHTEQTNDLADFLYQQNVDPTITMKTLKYFEYVWKRTNGSNAQQICRGLNSALMEDTLVFMYERALREVPLFGRVERSFIRVITQHLHEMYFLKGDTVIQCKDVQNDIFIIYRGKVDVLSTYNEMITCMGPGGMFGNFTGQSTSCSEVAIYASRSLDLLVLPSQTFFNLVKYYPKIQEPLRKAFEVSKDYILPISMDVDSDEESTEDSDFDLQSQDSAIDSRSGSSRFEVPVGQISVRSSHSNISQSKSAASVISYQSYMRLSNLFRPGTLLFQAFGYLTCIVATANYVLILYELVTLNDCYIIFWVQSAFDIFFYLKIYTYMHQSMTTVFLVVLFIHTFTCIWLVTLIAISPYQFIRTLKMHLIDEDTPQQRLDYTTSLYLVISELTGTGGDEIHIGDIFPMAILVICLICGKMLAAIVVATSIQIAYSTKYALNSYEMKTEELIDLLKNQGLSDYQLKKFWKYVRQLWVTERGRQLPDLMEKTPYVLRCDLMTAMFGHHLRNCYLFAETGEPFLRQLTAALNYTVFFPGNYIVVAGDSEARMFWVASGSVSVVSVRADLTETTHETLSAGDAFGMLQGLNRGVSHYFSYRADTKVGILTLSLDSWINILPYFPAAQKLISERSEVLFAQI